MTTAPPLFGVAAHARVLGASNLESAADPLTICTFEEAFQRHWDTDAHFVTYSAVGEGFEYLPRCNKPLLSKLRDCGADLVRHSFALDWDTPEHRPWGETITQDEFLDLFTTTAAQFHLLKDYACLYFTRSGARIVFILDEPVPVDESEAMLRWLIYRLRAFGFNCDELCDWTRLMRLPMVSRDGEGTEQAASFDMAVAPRARLSTRRLGKATQRDKATAYAEIKAFTTPKPDEETASSLIEFLDKGKMKPTDWAKGAKKRLSGRECFDCLFSNAPIAVDGARDSTLHRYLGQVISLLYYFEGTTPQHIHGLFLDAVNQFEQDPREPLWSDLLWSGVGRLWAKEEAKAAAQAMEAKETEARAEETRFDILSGMRQWSDHDALYGDEGTAKIWAEGHYIVSSGVSYYLIDNEGHYRSQPYSSSQLIPAIRRHLPDLIPTMVPTLDGKGMRAVSLESIISRHVTVVSAVTVQSGISRGYIENMDKPMARLVIPGFSRNENLVPEFNKDVDEWLKQVFQDDVDQACRWIAYALAFEDGPICAMSLIAEQGTGKKMLVQGLAECLTMPSIATDRDITSQYQDGLLRSPFLVVNEGWSGGRDGKHAADTFREISSGDPIVVHRKYKDPVEVRNPVRIIFTANNLDVIKKLAHKRDLTQTDRDALAIRLMHFDALKSPASAWLRMKGGRRFTGKEGSRWITPDAGGKSDYILAKHFLWLHKHRADFWETDSRLLVEGHGSQDLMFEMQTQVGSATLVVETILQMLDYKVYQDGLAIDGNRVYVLTAGILHYWRERLAGKIRGENLTAQSITKVLGGLCVGECENAFVVPGKENEKKGRKRWHEIDVDKLKRAADVHGFRCEKLDKIRGVLTIKESQ